MTACKRNWIQDFPKSILVQKIRKQRQTIPLSIQIYHTLPHTSYSESLITLTLNYVDINLAKISYETKYK